MGRAIAVGEEELIGLLAAVEFLLTGGSDDAWRADAELIVAGLEEIVAAHATVGDPRNSSLRRCAARPHRASWYCVARPRAG